MLQLCLVGFPIAVTVRLWYWKIYISGFDVLFSDFVRSGEDDNISISDCVRCDASDNIEDILSALASKTYVMGIVDSTL